MYDWNWEFWPTELIRIGMIALIVMAIWAVYRLVTQHKPARAEYEEQAQQILDQRLARGEIGDAEYIRLRDLIGKSHHQNVTLIDQPGA
ncbi:MAG TPA: hypothetical protein VFQ44_15510 [Streptosporangiaceae bacterium]|nr:hypothetical protein [Streptosporangiaceae bacterium]